MDELGDHVPYRRRPRATMRSPTPEPLKRMSSLIWLSPAQSAEVFPHPSRALREPNGLLAAGGDLEPVRLLAAYKQGIFPWYQDGQPILWWSPDPRAVLWPAGLKVSRSLRRSMRQRSFEFRVDTAFEAVVARLRGAAWLRRRHLDHYRDGGRVCAPASARVGALVRNLGRWPPRRRNVRRGYRPRLLRRVDVHARARCLEGCTRARGRFPARARYVP